jgi:hypothetical protein
MTTRTRYFAFCGGVCGILIYIVCLVIPYRLYLVPGPPPGYLRFPPLDLFAYLLVSYPAGWIWLALCAIMVVAGLPPSVKGERLVLFMRCVPLVAAIWAASYVRVLQDSLGSILE